MNYRYTLQFNDKKEMNIPYHQGSFLFLDWNVLKKWGCLTKDFLCIRRILILLEECINIIVPCLYLMRQLCMHIRLLLIKAGKCLKYI